MEVKTNYTIGKIDSVCEYYSIDKEFLIKKLEKDRRYRLQEIKDINDGFIVRIVDCYMIDNETLMLIDVKIERN